MPHESTVEHLNNVPFDLHNALLSSRTRIVSNEDELIHSKRLPLSHVDSNLPHQYAETPLQYTQVADDLLELGN